ncbi:MAG: carbon-nitrogen hydrolase family protein [Proteobacteria bacterium]|nr:carbon-nitrogen hydrolase family protein [Pseudomonadota bacterium]
MSKHLVAAIQFAAGIDVKANLGMVSERVAKAADRGAGLIVLPENLALMGLKETDKLQLAEMEGNGPIQDFLADLAVTWGVWIVGGSIPLRSSPGKVTASSLVFDDSGALMGRYDKIHLFDVDVPGSQEQYRESATIDAGDSPLILDSPFGKLGVTICYDLRFPELYRQMADAGVEIFAVPAAFTARTGAAHWELLLRARAVENLAYVVASGQGGQHENGRETYGNSMIVDPWGTVVARLGIEPGVAVAEIDLDSQRHYREAFPVLTHRRLDSVRYPVAT